LHIYPEDSVARAVLADSMPQDAEAWVNLSQNRFQRQDYAGCIAAAQQALKIKPGIAMAYNNMGIAYAALNQLDLAIQNEREALRLQPDLTLAKHNLDALISMKSAQTAPSGSTGSAKK
jgi:tetratricopeptide (TPR) repeat protein